jgi:hypothetical protein
VPASTCTSTARPSSAGIRARAGQEEQLDPGVEGDRHGTAVRVDRVARRDAASGLETGAGRAGLGAEEDGARRRRGRRRREGRGLRGLSGGERGGGLPSVVGRAVRESGHDQRGAGGGGGDRSPQDGAAPLESRGGGRDGGPGHHVVQPTAAGDVVRDVPRQRGRVIDAHRVDRLLLEPAFGALRNVLFDELMLVR